MDTSTALPEEHDRRKMSYVFVLIGCVLLIVAFAIGITDNMPGILSMLAGFFAVVLGIIYRFANSGKRKPAQQLLYWAPRVLTIVFAVFTGLFALDVFHEGQGFWETAQALFMHLIPTFLIFVVLAISWRREWIGGTVYVVLAIVYLVWAWGKPFGSTAIPLISGLLALMGALFFLNWRYRRELRGTA